MPLRNDLLNPISPDNPAGENLRYAPIIDKIKEARREDDDAPQGLWTRERKVADWGAVLKLTQEVLATKSKDLQVLAWLSEAALHREGIGTFRDVIDAGKGMLEQFWDGLYPELEDGDAEFRATPLQWIGDRLEMPVKQLALTRKGLNWFQYKEAQAIGSEKAADTKEKKAARQKEIDAGKITIEVFDKEFEETPKQFYLDHFKLYEATHQSLSSLGEVCDEKFGSAAPSFANLRSFLEEVRNTVFVLLQKKRETEPDPPEPEPEPEPQAEAEAEAAADGEPGETGASAGAASPSGALSIELGSANDAVRNLLAVAAYLRGKDELSPAPYLMTSGFRWGELRAKGEIIDPRMLAAPPSDVRQKLKSLTLDGAWNKLLKEAQTVAALECGRGWLDVHRYIARACSSLGAQYEPLRQAVISGVRGLLAHYPALPSMTLMDDTPTANTETLAWLTDEVFLPPAAETADGAQPIAFEPALEAAKSGRPEVAIQILMQELDRERTGRGRFLRKAQAARFCMKAGQAALAQWILQDLAAEIDSRKLEEWEAPGFVAQALAMLFQCLAADKAAEKQKLYDTICRLDPRTALTVQR